MYTILFYSSFLYCFLLHVRLTEKIVGKLGIFYLKYVQRKFIAMCVHVEEKLVLEI